MTDRKNLKISQETYELLREEKAEYETWDGLFHRVFDEDRSGYIMAPTRNNPKRGEKDE